jgi:hypothetical protein
MEARRKVGVQPRVIAEVPESQMGQMHAEKIGARTACPRVFSFRLEFKLQLVVVKHIQIRTPISALDVAPQPDGITHCECNVETSRLAVISKEVCRRR